MELLALAALLEVALSGPQQLHVHPTSILKAPVTPRELRGSVCGGGFGQWDVDKGLKDAARAIAHELLR